MSKTVKELLNHCKSAKNWKYVYGMKGKIMSLSQYLSLKSTYGSMVWDSDRNKVGCVCCDCSGLISSLTGIIRNSGNYKATAVETATLQQLKANWKHYVGWGIWKNGHIGVVSDTEGYYYAMDGSARNWVHYPLDKNNWVCVIKLRDIDYSVKSSLHFRGHIQDIGDKDYGIINADTVIGTVGESRRLEAVYLKGALMVRVHGQNYGWTKWYNATDGVWLGTKGKSLRIEAIQLREV